MKQTAQCKTKHAATNQVSCMRCCPAMSHRTHRDRSRTPIDKICSTTFGTLDLFIACAPFVLGSSCSIAAFRV